MSVAEIKFEREDRDGVIAVGSYLIDAAKRFGISFEGECVQAEGTHYCSAMITSGAPNLSPLTLAESEYFAANGRKVNERLACQAKIERPGEIVVMTKERKEETTDQTKVDGQNEKYKKDFAELPLEKKLAALAQLEAIALGETFSFIFNSPYMVFDKVMDVMAEFGLKKEQREKTAARPTEHESAKAKAQSQTETGRRRGSSVRKNNAKPKVAE